jgi:two-component system response regulator YesN
MLALYRTVLVEDETDIRRGLLTGVDWGAYNIEVVLDAPNGRVAYEYISRNPVDIIITDVVMPLMDGIELVRKVRQTDVGLKAVFISGYQDIDYIKSAFKVAAVDYIFKPVDLDELDTVLRRVVDACETDRIAREARRNDRLAVLARLLSRDPARRRQSASVLDAAELGWMENRHHTVVLASMIPVGVDYRKTGGGTPAGDADRAAGLGDDPVRADGVAAPRSGPFAAFRHVWETVVSADCENRVRTTLVPLDTEVAAIVSGADGASREAALAYSRATINAIKAVEAGWSATIGVGTEVAGAVALFDSASAARGALSESFYSGRNKVYDACRPPESAREDPSAVRAASELVVDAVRDGNRDKVRPALKTFVRALAVHAAHDPRITRALCIDLLFNLSSQLQSVDEEAAGELGRLERRGFDECKTLDEIYVSIAGPLETAAASVAAAAEQRAGFLCERIKAELRSAMSREITIEHLARKFLLTANYVSTLFKKQTGQTIHEYLTSLRIERAKQLLADPRLKLYQIASEVGYSDSDYFTKIFRKRVGITPRDYRNTELS